VTTARDSCAIRLWDVASGMSAGTLGDPAEGMFGVAWAPDGQTLACGGWDRALHIWDVTTRKERRPIPGCMRFRAAWVLADGRGSRGVGGHGPVGCGHG
jgi:WD40 repeat protein